MAKKTRSPTSLDEEHKKTLVGQYETITGRDWYDVEALMKAGDISATLIFIGDHIVNKIEEAAGRTDSHLSEKLENVWGQLVDLNGKRRKSVDRW